LAPVAIAAGAGSESASLLAYVVEESSSGSAPPLLRQLRRDTLADGAGVAGEVRDRDRQP